MMEERRPADSSMWRCRLAEPADDTCPLRRRQESDGASALGGGAARPALLRGCVRFMLLLPSSRRDACVVYVSHTPPCAPRQD